MRKRVFIFRKAIYDHDFIHIEESGCAYSICKDGLLSAYPHTRQATKVKVTITGEKPITTTGRSRFWSFNSTSSPRDCCRGSGTLFPYGGKRCFPYGGNSVRGAGTVIIYLSTAKLLRRIVGKEPFWITVEVLDDTKWGKQPRGKTA